MIINLRLCLVNGIFEQVILIECDFNVKHKNGTWYMENIHLAQNVFYFYDYISDVIN